MKIRIPSADEERVRDLVRCRQTFQREILRSRHYVTKFLARRGFVYREGKNWTQRHWAWLRGVLRDGGLEAGDRTTFGEYMALLEYKISRREDLDDHIERLALGPAYRAATETSSVASVASARSPR